MHPYDLSDRQAAVVACVDHLARVVLADLDIPFTPRFLRDTAARTYLRTTARVTLDEDGGAALVDWEDPANVALIVAETLKTYHVKHEVVDAPVLQPGTSTLVLARPDGSMGYAELLGVIRGGGRLEWPAAEGSGDRPTLEVDACVVLARTRYSAEPGFAANARRERIRRSATAVLPVLALGIGAAATAEGVRTVPPLQWVPLLLLWAAGIYLSYLLVMLEKTSTYANALLARVCGAETGDPTCKTVIGSPGSRLFGFSLTDLGAVYFATLACTATLALLTNQLPRFHGVFLAAAVLPVPFSLYLLYQQAFVLRRFCALCVGVHGVLLLQLGWFLAVRPAGAVALPGISALAVTAAVAIAVIAAYAIAHEAWRLTVRTWELTVERERTLGDPAYFEVAAGHEREYELGELPGSILLGNPEAPLQLTAVLSLACSPCATKLAELRRLADWLGDDLSVRVLLRADATTVDGAAEVLRWSLSGRHEAALDFLDRWYAALDDERARGRDRVELSRVLDRARAQSGAAPEPPDLQALLDLHEQAMTNVVQTPVLIYRGRRVPPRYGEASALVDVLEQHVPATVG